MNPTILPHGSRTRHRDGAPTLNDLRPGRECVVRRLAADPDVRQRLMELGIVAGTRLRVVKVAPLGDPMQIRLKGYHLSLRRSEARTILVEPA